jgi:hypothetical protein
MDGQTGRPTGRKKERQTDVQTEKHTDRHKADIKSSRGRHTVLKKDRHKDALTDGQDKFRHTDRWMDMPTGRKNTYTQTNKQKTHK